MALLSIDDVAIVDHLVRSYELADEKKRADILRINDEALARDRGQAHALDRAIAMRELFNDRVRR